MSLLGLIHLFSNAPEHLPSLSTLQISIFRTSYPAKNQHRSFCQGETNSSLRFLKRKQRQIFSSALAWSLSWINPININTFRVGFTSGLASDDPGDFPGQPRRPSPLVFVFISPSSPPDSRSPAGTAGFRAGAGSAAQRSARGALPRETQPPAEIVPGHPAGKPTPHHTPPRPVSATGPGQRPRPPGAQLGASPAPHPAHRTPLHSAQRSAPHPSHRTRASRQSHPAQHRSPHRTPRIPPRAERRTPRSAAPRAALRAPRSPPRREHTAGHAPASRAAPPCFPGCLSAPNACRPLSRPEEGLAQPGRPRPAPPGAGARGAPPGLGEPPLPAQLHDHRPSPRCFSLEGSPLLFSTLLSRAIFPPPPPPLPKLIRTPAGACRWGIPAQPRRGSPRGLAPCS